MFMKIDQSQIEEVRSAFDQMQSREDFIDLLNHVKPMLYSGKTHLFTLKQLTWYSNPNLGGKRYTEFRIKKKSGGDRSIHAPVHGLKSIQKALSFILQCVFEPHTAAMGFSKGRSIVDNARIHQGSNYIYNIDLKDFFPSINQSRVWACMQLKPFYLKENQSSDTINTSDSFFLVPPKKISTRKDIANMIGAICCTEMTVERQDANGQWIQVKNNVLPQGAPTSPVITNIVCQKLDFLLTGVANKFGLKYTRYADDITFSSPHNVYQNEGEFLKELHRIIKEQGFHIKESKTRLQKKGYKQEVTGLVVNEIANVHKRYVKQLRMWLYYWERYGYKRAEQFFLEKYIVDRGHLLLGRKPNMVMVIAGKLDFLRMVKGDDNPLYINLNKRFKVLVKEMIPAKNATSSGKRDLDTILDRLLKYGLDDAMKLYSLN
jgi:RNA-directed DNA polymerase